MNDLILYIIGNLKKNDKEMTKEIDAQSGEGVINKPDSRFELIEIKRYESKTLRATIHDTEKKKEIYVDAYFDGNAWKAKTGMEEYSPSDTRIMEWIIQNAMNDKIIVESSKLGLEIEKADFVWNLFLFSKREDIDDLKSAVRAKIVNTGINRYIEFEEHLQGFQDGEILTYRKCEDGTSVIVKGSL